MFFPKGCLDVEGAPPCCHSCHEDHDDYGYSLCWHDIDGQEYEVCCAVSRHLDQRTPTR